MNALVALFHDVSGYLWSLTISQVGALGFFLAFTIKMYFIKWKDCLVAVCAIFFVPKLIYSLLEPSGCCAVLSALNYFMDALMRILLAGFLGVIAGAMFSNYLMKQGKITEIVRHSVAGLVFAGFFIMWAIYLFNDTGFIQGVTFWN